jgi:hypothetical protein
VPVPVKSTGVLFILVLPLTEKLFENTPVPALQPAGRPWLLMMILIITS